MMVTSVVLPSLEVAGDQAYGFLTAMEVVLEMIVKVPVETGFYLVAEVVASHFDCSLQMEVVVEVVRALH